MAATATESDRFQSFLDSKQYTLNGNFSRLAGVGILRYEFVFGEGYISSGGIETTKELLNTLTLPKGSRVLDIGSGIGGGCAFLADRFGVHVHGVDLSANVVAIAQERYGGRSDLKFEVADAVTLELPPASLDLIYSRDSILHLSVEQKRILFTNCFKWLKPGGQVFITDYCAISQDMWDSEFSAYVKSRGYTLLSVEGYAALLEEVGFKVKIQRDITERWIQSLISERSLLKNKESEFLKRFKQEDFNELSSSWEAKIERAQKHIQLWGFFTAIKP
ncbi:hypothetical protein IE077_003590 [Cardiosporidium cionae]|uniref:phosphoethanolamine N-methyltransferase n=1 Tax=Cardiosporidium cionae TaxID=476202 RepID=A0ABQ7J7W5_9APIC|nr:hypothetical protein IE077_003590 [Cardiosporidium cionae]|eukprot:KAF8820085.1 hypothetical protein IE077_003590 [Cardiosporidium cionae]